MARLDAPGAVVPDALAWGADPHGQAVRRPDITFPPTFETELRPKVPTFTNPLYSGADPWVSYRDGFYFLCQAGPCGRLEVWKSDTLTERGQRRIVWTPPRKGWNRAQVW